MKICARMITILAAVWLCGCEGEDPADPGLVEGPTSDSDVILHIEIESGHSVSFHEPLPGALYVVEQMAPEQTFVLGDTEASDAIAAFVKLRPGVEVPPVLKAAYDRASNQRVNPEAGSPGLGGGQPATTKPDGQRALTSSSSAANFVNNNGGCNWGPQMSFCRVNWANGFWASWSPASSGLCIVDHYAGNGVVVQITANGVVTSFFQGGGTIAQYSLGSPGANVARRIDITNASGDSFHVGCRWGV